MYPMKPFPAQFTFPLIFLLFIAGIGQSCQEQAKSSNKKMNPSTPLRPDIQKTVFGQLTDGREAHLYTLSNRQGMQARISNYGGILVALLVPDEKGEPADVVLGFDQLASYEKPHPSFGTTVGRYANRIAKGQFTLNGKSHQLALNNGANHLHGGLLGFDKKLWTAQTEEDDKEQRLILEYLSVDGEEQYPGNLKVKVTYALNEANELSIHYEATTDQSTVVNFTHHSYFNLAGQNQGNILDHQLQVLADSTTEVGSGLIPTGRLTEVNDTPFDFRKATAIGARIQEENEQLKLGNGYDHNWVIRDWDQSLRLAATLFDPNSGRYMEVQTTEPGIQVYTANWLSDELKGKGDQPFQPYQGICLETQHYPDSPNHPHFPTTALHPGETYRQTTVYRFSNR
ncbi:MAG: aldose epimerase family protein [Bacteroidota bacterium]